MQQIKFKNLLLIRPFKISTVLIILIAILALVMTGIENDPQLRELFRTIGIPLIFKVIFFITIIALVIPSELLGLRRHTSSGLFGFVEIQSIIAWALGFIFLYLIVFILSIIISVIFELLKVIYLKVKQKYIGNKR